LREKAANFDWRADPLIPKVKRAFGSRLAGVLEFITLGALPTRVAALGGL
jgi:hypothetical protein